MSSMGRAGMRTPTLFSLEGKRVYVAGHRGMVGSAIVRRLRSENCTILFADHASLDLTRGEQVDSWLRQIKPDAVFLAAAKVGGIFANSSLPVDFLEKNL